jgi:hypothetical protein
MTEARAHVKHASDTDTSDDSVRIDARTVGTEPIADDTATWKYMAVVSSMLTTAAVLFVARNTCFSADTQSAVDLAIRIGLTYNRSVCVTDERAPPLVPIVAVRRTLPAPTSVRSLCRRGDTAAWAAYLQHAYAPFGGHSGPTPRDAFPVVADSGTECEMTGGPHIPDAVPVAVECVRLPVTSPRLHAHAIIRRYAVPVAAFLLALSQPRIGASADEWAAGEYARALADAIPHSCRWLVVAQLSVAHRGVVSNDTLTPLARVVGLLRVPGKREARARRATDRAMAAWQAHLDDIAEDGAPRPCLLARRENGSLDAGVTQTTCATRRVDGSVYYAAVAKTPSLAALRTTRT